MPVYLKSRMTPNTHPNMVAQRSVPALLGWAMRNDSCLGGVAVGAAAAGGGVYGGGAGSARGGCRTGGAVVAVGGRCGCRCTRSLAASAAS